MADVETLKEALRRLEESSHRIADLMYSGGGGGDGSGTENQGQQ